MGDITFEVEMVEKMHNQEIYLTFCPEHQNDQHESRAISAFLQKKIFKKKSALNQDLEIKNINSERYVILAKAVDALSRKRSLKPKKIPNHT